MSKQYHYIVMWDEETKEWSVDFDVAINYGEGDVWDTSTEEWSFASEHDDHILNELKEKLSNG